MPRFSEVVHFPGGSAIVCGSRPRHPRCATPGCRGEGAFQCDWPVEWHGKPGTCDRHCCRGCATEAGPERHYCPPHQRLVDSRTNDEVDLDG